MARRKKARPARAELKQIIVVREDLELSKGKVAAQAAHASLEAFLASDKKVSFAWLKKGAKKVVLACKDGKELKALHDKAKGLGIVHSLISDAGLTEVPRGTITALGIGPDEEKRIDKITGSLPLMQ